MNSAREADAGNPTASGYWFGQVPRRWSVHRIKDLMRPVDSRSDVGTQRLLSMRMNIGLVPSDEFSSRPASPEDLIGYKVVRAGQLVVNRMQAGNGLIFLSTTDGLVSPDYGVFQPKTESNLTFLGLLFRSPTSRTHFRRLSKGLGTGTSGFLRLYDDDFLAVRLALPERHEQDVIVRFVEEKERDIEHYLATKRRMIDVLKEQRVLAVERVLQRSTSALPSSTRPVPWFGDVPTAWRTFRLKHVASHIVDCLHETPDYLQDGEYPAVRTADVVPGRLDLHRAKRVDHATFIRRIDRLRPQGGDIVYSREGERFGIAASVPPGVDLCVSQRMMHFRIRPEFDAEYVMWLLNSRAVYLQASVDQNGATAPHVNVERIRNFLFVIPDLSTQREMVRMVEHEVSELDAAVLILEREITAMEEYRTRLIADAVTGQIDVRSLG